MPTISLFRNIRSVVLPLSLIVALNSVFPYAAQAQPTGTVKPGPEALSLQESFSRVASAVEPAVVNISTLIEEKPDQS
jgi:S1-C subfamily serine protease